MWSSLNFQTFVKVSHPRRQFSFHFKASCRGGVILNLQQCLMEQIYESRTIDQYVAISEG